MRKILFAALLSMTAATTFASTLTVAASAVKITYLPSTTSGVAQLYLTGSTGSGCGGVCYGSATYAP